MTQECAVEFVQLNDFPDYEILNVYPFTIRRKETHREVKDTFDKSSGYIRVRLNEKKYRKHRLIALQFLPNPDNLPEVDHINHDKTDYHISNLRWVTHSDNCKNRSSNKGVVYEFVDDIPDDSIKVNDYGKYQFDDYYYCDNIFYFYNGIQYRKLHINEFKNGSKYVNMFDTNGKHISVYYSKFKKNIWIRLN